MGPLQDIFFNRFFAIVDLSLIDDTQCGSIILTYPGQPIYFSAGNIDGATNCLDLAAQYGSLWSDTIPLKANQYNLV